MTKLISIVTPTYAMGGKGTEALDYMFRSLKIQTFSDFNVIVSDDSDNTEIRGLCMDWSNKLDIHYHKNEKEKGGASNLNNAIQKADGKWVRVLLQDDLFFDENSLQIIVDNLDDSVIWMFTDYVHSNDRIKTFKQHHPTMNPDIATVNTLGTPSAMTLKNGIELPTFDNALIYCYDEEFYYQMWKKYGDPKIIDQVTMVNLIWDQSVTSKITPDLIMKENSYIMNKHGLVNPNDVFNRVVKLT